jgi:hypothetical protein
MGGRNETIGAASLAVVLTVPGEEGMEAMSVFSVVSTAR